MQAAYDTDIGSSEELKNLSGFLMSDQKADWLVTPIAVPGINVFGQRQCFVLQVAVAGKFASRRCGDLDKREPPAPLRLVGQQLIHRFHSVDDAFGVVEPFDTDSKFDIGRKPKCLPYLRSAVADRWLSGQRLRGPFNRNWIGPYHRFVTARCNRRTLTIDAALDEAIYRLEEIVAMELSVKSEDCAAEKAIYDALFPWADAKGFCIGPRDMPEGNDRRFG